MAAKLYGKGRCEAMRRVCGDLEGRHLEGRQSMRMCNVNVISDQEGMSHNRGVP